jgi:type II secretory pathway pseudopilin PulG
MMHRQNESGYVALISVLIVGAISLAAALGILTSGTDAQRSVLTQQQSAQALGLANACAEEALQVMQATTTFTGSGNLTLSTGSCLYTITNTGGQNRVIDTTGTVNDVVRKLKVYVTIGSTSISITSWQEVADAS